MERVLEAQAEEQLDKDAIAEFDRYRRMDEWSSSYVPARVYGTKRIKSRSIILACINCAWHLRAAREMQAKMIDLDLMRFVPYTRAGTYDLLRIQAFQCLVSGEGHMFLLGYTGRSASNPGRSF
jgi:transcription initiation factor TFIID subunit 2